MKLSKNPYRIPKQFLGAFKCGHRVSAREFIDEDLAYTLLSKIIDSNWKDEVAISELEYLTKFNNEYHKNVVKKGDTNAIHQEQLSGIYNKKGVELTMRQACYDRENSKNVDISSVMKSSLVSDAPLYGDLKSMEHETFLNSNRDLLHHEDTLIDLISSKEFQEDVKTLKKLKKSKD